MTTILSAILPTILPAILPAILSAILSAILFTILFAICIFITPLSCFAWLVILHFAMTFQKGFTDRKHLWTTA